MPWRARGKVSLAWTPAPPLSVREAANPYDVTRSAQHRAQPRNLPSDPVCDCVQSLLTFMQCLQMLGYDRTSKNPSVYLLMLANCL